MIEWKRTIKIKHFLGDGKPPKEIGERIGKVLDMRIKQEERDEDLDIDEIIYMFQEDVGTVELLDNALFELYNWADSRLVWIA